MRWQGHSARRCQDGRERSRVPEPGGSTMPGALNGVVVIAHRGASGYAPEHTFAAWDRALAQGADFLEQDLQLTRDGVLVVLHDETLDRTVRANGQPCTGLVSSCSLAELRGCEVGSWFNEAHPDLARPEYELQSVPTIEEVLRRYAGRASCYIETKQPESAPGMEEALLTLLRRFHLLEPARQEWQVLVQSFSEASLRKLHALEPGLPLIQLLEEQVTELEILERLDAVAEFAVGIGPYLSGATASVLASAHGRCLAVHPYTVNEPADQARVLAAGVDGVFTDYPDRLIALRPPTEPRGAAAGAAAAAARARCLIRSGGKTPRS
ncbi:MAG: glycerophosphodiester phosphodiesterase [Chloroflexi bacterium]|nr:glycerophosphodiester phosphodiesterase [Chloroflexota bacterium]